jgi:hypothetical protein
LKLLAMSIDDPVEVALGSLPPSAINPRAGLPRSS